MKACLRFNLTQGAWVAVVVWDLATSQWCACPVLSQETRVAYPAAVPPRGDCSIRCWEISFFWDGMSALLCLPGIATFIGASKSRAVSGCRPKRPLLRGGNRCRFHRTDGWKSGHIVLAERREHLMFRHRFYEWRLPQQRCFEGWHSKHLELSKRRCIWPEEFEKSGS